MLSEDSGCTENFCIHGLTKFPLYMSRPTKWIKALENEQYWRVYVGVRNSKFRSHAGLAYYLHSNPPAGCTLYGGRTSW